MIALGIPAADFGTHTLTFVSDNSNSPALFALGALAAVQAGAAPTALFALHAGAAPTAKGSPGVTMKVTKDHKHVLHGH